jgi:CopG family transcriptional regulator, nickel-responsive regulator
VHDLSDRLTEQQHQHHREIISALHVHLDAHNCLEVLVVRGKAAIVKKIADALIGVKGVKHGKLVMTTTGTAL